MICLIAALVWYGKLLQRGLTLLLREQVATVNAQVVGQLSSFVSEWNLSDLSPGSADRARLQSLVERVQLPNNGFLCVIDGRTGEAICHLTQRKGANEAGIRKEVAELQEKLGQIPRHDTIGGWFTLSDGMHHLTIQRVPRSEALLVADLPESGLWAARNYVMEPLWGFGVFVAVVLAFLGTLSSMGIIHRYENTLEDINAHLEKTVAQRSRALVNTRDAVIFGLAKLADSRDADTGEHLDRVHEYIAIVARKLAATKPEIDDEYIERLKIASSLHDIGKVGIRDEILLKPGKLTREERQIMQTHGVIGARCLAAIQDRLGDDDFLDMACEIAAAHHERWDGGGYPYGLSGEEIPLPARIVAVVDVYDALTTQRVYRAATSHEEACQMILEGAGTQFDPVVVAAFRECQDEIREIAERFANMAQTADDDRIVAGTVA